MLACVHIRFDSGQPGSGSRSYSDPVALFTAARVTDVRQVLNDCQAALDDGLHVAGFLSYEAAPAFDAAFEVRSGGKLPLACFAAYRDVSREAPPEPAAYSLAPWQPSATAERHRQAVEAIRSSISAGETYQVNHTFRLHSQLQGCAGGLYQDMLQRQPAAFAAFLECEAFQLLSASPELFFRRRGQRLETRPMKGTIRRGGDPAADQLLQRELLGSAKDAAENVMITDLLRNDLGRLAVPGTVTVDALLQLESLPTFHALTSTVSALLPNETRFPDVFAALFPCGSITGAPKVSTMRLISQLEDSVRGSYCGTIGFAEPGGDWVFNVAIRTLEVDRLTGGVTYGTGGGVTWDSDAAGEYREALLKASFLPQAPAAWRGGR